MKLAACWGIAALVAATPVAHGEGLAPAKEPDAAEETVAGGGEDQDPALPPARATARGPEVFSYSHKGQFMVSGRIGVGMRAIIAYDGDDYCGATDSSTSSGNAPVCTGRAPLSFDLELGYGLSDRIDTFVELRVGLESDFGATATVAEGPRMFHLAPGARFFFSDSKHAKLFTTAQVVLDLAGYKDVAGMSRGVDFGIRNLSGLWIDLDRAYGFYAYVGETATFGRWIRMELEAGVGLQGRYR